jgi:hypothetical protein
MVDGDFKDYWHLNDVLNREFFSGQFAHQPVYLDLEDEARRDIATELGIAEDEVEEHLGLRVAETCEAGGTNVYKWHQENLEAWLLQGRKSPPPFTALLCALSLAAERMRQGKRFSANNYYERLFAVLGIEDGTEKSKFKQSAKHTRRFWRTLNQWLIEQDLELGRPTAKQVNSWRYVSYALSQALVRDADRKRFHELFVQFGLSPFEEVNEAEMMLFLDEWMASGNTSAWLKKIWTEPDLRERVCTAAVFELQAWDGAGAENNSEGLADKKFSWAASLSSFPSRRLQLFLSAMDKFDENSSTLALSDGAPVAAKKAFENCSEGTWLSSAAGADFVILEPTKDIELSALMLASFELEEAGTGKLYAHAARPVIPLIKLETGAYYREVSRTSLLRRHLIICHESWQAQVRQHLEMYAHSDFKELNARELPGLPADWALFQDVEMLGIANEVHNDLQSLVPLSEGVSMQIVDGLNLSPGTWHQGAPPSVMAASEDGDIKIQLREENFSDVSRVLLESDSSGATCSLQISEAEIPEGANLYVVAVQGKQDKAEKHFSLRSANVPRPILNAGLEYQPEGTSATSWMTAQSPQETGDDAGKVVGMIAPETGLDPVGADTTQSFFLDIDDTYESESFSNEFRLNRIDGLGETCVIRAYHYWMCPTIQPDGDKKAAKLMNCKDCGLSVLARQRGGKRKSKKGKAPRPVPQTVAPVGNITRGRHLDITPDLLLDALCYLGSGNWRSFQSIASTGADEPWFPSEFARNLQDLGHLDLQMNSSLSRTEQWSISPPTLVVTGNKAFLSGFRTSKLVEAVEQALQEIGAKPIHAPQEGSPNRLAWEGLDINSARDATNEIADPHGRPITVVGSPAAFIVQSAVPLRAILEELPSAHFDSPPDLARFNPRNGKWERCENSREPAAYRTTFAGRRYFLRTSSGDCKEASFEIVKVLAAASERVRLHGYDPDTRVFEAAPGCGPPGLLRRALVASSGALPSIENGRLRYEDVPPAIAARVMTILYGG